MIHIRTTVLLLIILACNSVMAQATIEYNTTASLTMQGSAQARDFRDYEPRPHTLNEEAVNRIRERVLRKCAIRSADLDENLPWYFNYEFGLELMDAGDYQRGLDALVLAANQRQESQRNKRMYGMWYTHYLPYFQIAQAHSKLGNWQCALDALRVSTEYAEFSPVNRDYAQFSDLQKMIMLNTAEQ